MHLRSASSRRCSVGNKETRDRQTSSKLMLPSRVLCWLACVMLLHTALYQTRVGLGMPKSYDRMAANLDES